MRAITKIGAAAAAVGLAATMAACSSSGSAKPVGQFKTLTGNSTSVKLDAGFVKALTALKLTPGTVGSATLNGSTGVVSFPITGGNATIYNKGDVTPYVQGVIDHNGSGLTLTAGSTKVTLENFVVHPGNNSKLTGKVLVNGKTAFPSADLFTLDGSTLKKPTISGGVATLTGTKVEISSDAAAALNKVFKTNAVKAGLLVGVATIKATGK